jgi:protein SCO1
MCAPRNPLARTLAAACGIVLSVALASACGGSATSPAAVSDSRAQGPGPSTFLGAALPLEGAHDFALDDAFGGRADTREYRGRVVVLAFLGTRCGAPCVVIAQQVRGALDELPSPVAVLLVSVDPRADTRASVARFLQSVSLSARARYLDGPPQALRAVWRAYHVPAPAAAAAAGAAFSRFAPVVLLDQSGRARVAYALETLTPESLAHDIRALSR